jgi:hypothetical protein
MDLDCKIYAFYESLFLENHFVMNGDSRTIFKSFWAMSGLKKLKDTPIFQLNILLKWSTSCRLGHSPTNTFGSSRSSSRAKRGFDHICEQKALFATGES